MWRRVDWYLVTKVLKQSAVSIASSIFTTLKMEAASSSETLVTIYQFKQRNPQNTGIVVVHIVRLQQQLNVFTPCRVINLNGPDCIRLWFYPKALIHYWCWLYSCAIHLRHHELFCFILFLVIETICEVKEWMGVKSGSKRHQSQFSTWWTASRCAFTTSK
jgi:hypothetical protein